MGAKIGFWPPGAEKSQQSGTCCQGQKYLFQGSGPFTNCLVPGKDSDGPENCRGKADGIVKTSMQNDIDKIAQDAGEQDQEPAQPMSK